MWDPQRNMALEGTSTPTADGDLQLWDPLQAFLGPHFSLQAPGLGVRQATLWRITPGPTLPRLDTRGLLGWGRSLGPDGSRPRVVKECGSGGSLPFFQPPDLGRAFLATGSHGRDHLRELWTQALCPSVARPRAAPRHLTTSVWLPLPGHTAALLP